MVLSCTNPLSSRSLLRLFPSSWYRCGAWELSAEKGTVSGPLGRLDSNDDAHWLVANCALAHESKDAWSASGVTNFI
jgi:hypothetical protein